jgi:hypothetical protein
MKIKKGISNVFVSDISCKKTVNLLIKLNLKLNTRQVTHALHDLYTTETTIYEHPSDFVCEIVL